jgi:hypothetical protein
MTRWYSVLNSHGMAANGSCSVADGTWSSAPHRRYRSPPSRRWRCGCTGEKTMSSGGCTDRTERTDGPAQLDVSPRHLVTSLASPGSRRRRGAVGSLSVTRGAGRGAVMGRVWLDQVGSESCSFSHKHGTKQRSGSTRRCRFGLTRLHRGPKPVQRGSKLVSKPRELLYTDQVGV